jgi:DNA-binding MarR family transcriptional regulator
MTATHGSRRPERPRAAPARNIDVERKLERIGELVRRLLRSMRIPDDATELTPTQLVVLSHLDEQPMRVGVLAGRMGAAQNTISEVVARLERSGMVSKQRDPDDHRAVLVGLAPVGRRMLERRRAIMRGAHRAVIEALSPADRVRFVEAFELLVEMTERAREQVSPPNRPERRSK